MKIIAIAILSIFQILSISNPILAQDNPTEYTNPIIHADYSDPDVVRVGDDYYMTASSFNCVPGLPILHSKDLINWELIAHALKKLIPEDYFSSPQHGKGVWAPCIRFVNDEFYIYYPDPDHGIYLTKAKNARGPWSEPILVKEGKGLIDPSPLWDDDKRVYLTYAFAGSRAGIKSILMLCELSADGTSVIGEDIMLFDGHDKHPTVEGPKFYKYKGFYYIFAPAGGVTHGWQLVLRSKNVLGPYEEKIVMDQGNTNINGPHQGAWIDTESGEHWFIHFQDKEAYGRIVHLQPMTWKNNWPLIGNDTDNDGIGAPVISYKKPNVGSISPVLSPPDSDDFDTYQSGLQWQWHANPKITFGFPSAKLGFYRLNCIPRPSPEANLWTVPNLFLQKLPASAFTATTKVKFTSYKGNDEAGFLIMGLDYQYIAIEKRDDKYYLKVSRCEGAEKNIQEKILFEKEINKTELYFKIEVKEEAKCVFSYSMDGKKFKPLDDTFQAKPGKWIGAKIGYFALRNDVTNDGGTLDIDWIKISK